VIIERSMHPSFLSNSYLVADRPGGHGVLVDTGGPAEPILRRIRELRLTPTHVLCTHHHVDHVSHNADYRSRFDVPVCGHADERELFGGLDVELADGEQIISGELRLRALHVPGHTLGQLAFVVEDHCVFTGDTLFRRTIGGTRGPGHARFEDLQRSIMDVLMRLPRELSVRPGHTEPTTIGEEWEHNPFIRVWRGLDPEGRRRCSAFGEPATLLVEAEDYDGGTKCQVRFDAGARLDVVPGSRVQLRD
jgi:glyoxylase-like metal-dependent hydrolase (beta-lactamase superfamily II)